jgi:hypothetical protein
VQFAEFGYCNPKTVLQPGRQISVDSHTDVSTSRHEHRETLFYNRTSYNRTSYLTHPLSTSGIVQTIMSKIQRKRVPDVPQLDSSQELWFEHPGHVRPGHGDVSFLTLPACDCSGPGTESTGQGVHYGTALHACMIIACNAPGFFHTELISPDHPEDFARIKAEAAKGFDDILEAKASEWRTYYYFYTLDWPQNPCYPLCSSFGHWSFPSEVPPEWQLCYNLSPQKMSWAMSLDLPADSRRKSTRCPVTRYPEPLSAMRLIDSSYLSWVSASVNPDKDDH